MKSPIRKFLMFFAKPKKLNTTAVRNTASATYDEESDDTKLSGAFIVVLILHIVAVVGIVAFTKIKDNRKSAEIATAPSPTKDKKQKSLPTGTVGTSTAKPAQIAPDDTQVNVPVVENHPPKTLPSTGTQIHIVKQGETYTKLATTYGTTVAELTRLNGSRATDPLTIGQALNLPEKNSLPPLPAIPERQTDAVKNSPPKPAVPSPSSTKLGTYTVKKGDSMMKIARENKVSYDELAKFNKGVDPKKLQPGQTVKIPITR